MSVALTSLLNSLHSHIQSQTQLLPRLHAQLGLPPTALEDELMNLEQLLMQSVDVSIDSRRKEVEEWLEKCEAVESECVRYAKALGGNVKATGNSVGELKKEKVLPQRYHLVSEYREKLRQLYHSKLEQLLSLTNRLNGLCRTLGPDFFSSEVVDPSPASGENSGDPSTHRDVTPERFSKLEKELVRGKAEVSKRLCQLSATMIQIDWLYTELGIPQPTLEDLPSPPKLSYLPSAATSNGSSAASSDLFLSVSTSCSTPTPSSGSKSASLFLLPDDPSVVSDIECQRIFARFVARVEEAEDENLPESAAIPIGLENVEPTPGLLAWATSTRAALEDTKKRREAHIQAMYDQLEALWRRLGVLDGDMDVFVEQHRGTTEETVKEYEAELERMLELKRERMSVFVGSAREEISKLWDDLMVGEEERADFAPFFDDEYTEELLSVHENEIKRLKDEKRMKGMLLANIKKYFDICQEEKELAAAASDQSRLLGRGSRDPGRLLREEKMRKRVTKEKPRLEQDLLASIPAWEASTGRQFLVHGESILHILMETVSAADQENKRKPPRAGSVPPRATTPVNAMNHYLPGSAGYGVGSKSGMVIPAIRSGSSLEPSSAPVKRQRLGEQQSSNGAGQRVPLGVHRGVMNTNHQRPPSPSKIAVPGKTPNGAGMSSLPRPVAMPIPRPGTQHFALGHGRIPSGGYGSATVYQQPQAQQVRSTSGASGLSASTRIGSGGSGVYHQQGVARKASRARRESFKPRPSMDGPEVGFGTGFGFGGARWGDIAPSVKEEDEGY